MPKGPKGEKRPADTNACAVHVAKIATGEIEDDRYEVPNRRKSGMAGAAARKEVISASRRREIATQAARKRWKEGGSAMTTARQELAERFAEMKKNGLKDMKFFLGQVSEATVEHVCNDVNRVLKMNDEGRYTVLDKWGDKPEA